MAADGDRAVDAGLRAWIRPRARIVLRAVAAGVVVGVGLVLALLASAGDARFASTQAFAVGALLLSVGLLGWSGSIFAGRGIENMQRHLDTGTGWSERDSRRAMARVGSFGAGVMTGTVLVTTPL